MQAALKAEQADVDSDNDDDQDGQKGSSKHTDQEQDSDAEEQGIQDEIQKLQLKKLREQEKLKKKE